MSDRALADRKAAVRSRMLVARADLQASAREAASARIRHRAAALPQLATARAVLGYAAFGSEVDLDPLLQAWIDEGRGVFLPFVDGEDLGIARVHDLEADLAPGWGGVREPKASGRRRANPAQLHAAVVPGVAFDRLGRRLGYGGGHFDRLLARLSARAAVVGVGFSSQVVEQLPVEPHDVPVTAVVTEEEVVVPPGAR